MDLPYNIIRSAGISMFLVTCMYTAKMSLNNEVWVALWPYLSPKPEYSESDNAYHIQLHWCQSSKGCCQWSIMWSSICPLHWHVKRWHSTCHCQVGLWLSWRMFYPGTHSLNRHPLEWSCWHFRSSCHAVRCSWWGSWCHCQCATRWSQGSTGTDSWVELSSSERLLCPL